MRAIRVQKKGVKHTVVHWLTDDEETTCGRPVDSLDVIEDLDLEQLPTVEGCRGCARAAGDVPNQPDYRIDRSSLDERGLGGYHVALPASLGRIRKTGSLRKGTGRSGRGHPLR